MTAQSGDIRLGVAEVDVEHALQMQLVEALRTALDAGDVAAAQEAFGRLDDVTNAHFLAEQLLMRLHAYPDHDAHVQEHDRLVAELRELSRHWSETGEAASIARRVELWLRVHIATSDDAFAAYLKQERGGAPVGS